MELYFIQTFGVDIWIYTNADISNLDAAVINWYFRTQEFTAESLCAYINSKGLHKASTEKPKDQ